MPQKGTFVRKISRKDVDDNFVLRAYLEGLAARLAIDYLTHEDTQKMEKALKGMHEATMRNKVENYLRCHNEFHEIFINACENRALIEILNDLRKIASWFRVHSTKYSISTHREIVDLFINKSADKVEALVKEHILAARNRFLEIYKNLEADQKGS